VLELWTANLGFRRFFLGVLSAETFHPAGGIHKLLLAGKEGMAIGTNFYVDVSLVGRTSGKAVAARAHDADFVVSGMNGCFHDLYNLCTEPFDSKGWLKDSANRVASRTAKLRSYITASKSPITARHSPTTNPDDYREYRRQAGFVIPRLR
jgi:hypothetical protein